MRILYSAVYHCISIVGNMRRDGCPEYSKAETWNVSELSPAIFTSSESDGLGIIQSDFCGFIGVHVATVWNCMIF